MVSSRSRMCILVMKGGILIGRLSLDSVTSIMFRRRLQLAMTFSEHLIMLPVRLASTCSSTDTVIVTLRSKIRVVLISGTGSGLPHVVLT